MSNTANDAASLATAPTLERFEIPSIDRAEVLRYLGYRGQTITPELEGRLQAGMEHCLAVCEPAGVWRVFELAPEKGNTCTRPPLDAHCSSGGDEASPTFSALGPSANGDDTTCHPERRPEGPKPKDPPRREAQDASLLAPIRLAGSTLELPGTSIAEHLAGARAAALLTVTLGLVSERELQRLALVDPLEQLIFDASATALAERAADALEARIVAHAAERGLYTNDRFAPGYGDLPLTVQPQLIEVLNARRLLGMSLTPSHMLVPTKSETAVVGIFDFVPARREGGLCSSCAMRDFCSIRGTGRTCRSA